MGPPVVMALAPTGCGRGRLWPLSSCAGSVADVSRGVGCATGTGRHSATVVVAEVPTVSSDFPLPVRAPPRRSCRGGVSTAAVGVSPLPSSSFLAANACARGVRVVVCPALLPRICRRVLACLVNLLILVKRAAAVKRFARESVL